MELVSMVIAKKASRKPKKKAWGKGRVYRRGNSWALRWTENGKRLSDAGHQTQNDAQKVLDGILANIQAGRAGMPERPKDPTPTFGALVTSWFEAREQDDHRSVHTDRSRWKQHLEPLLASRAMDTVDSGLLSNLIRDLRKPPMGSLGLDGKPRQALSNATVGHVMHLLSAFYKWAKREKKVVLVNPVRELISEMSAKDKKRIKSTHNPETTPFLQTKADVLAVFKALPEPINIAFAISALAGLRPGEVTALEWTDIDFAKSIITVSRQIQNGKVTVPKSGHGRTVDVVPGLLAVLQAHRNNNPKSTLVIEPLRYRKGGMRRNRHGVAKYLNRRTITSELETVLTKLGLPTMTFYEAGRHTFASQWVLAGNDIYRLSKLMGHSSVVTTQRYAHLTRKTPEDVLARANIDLTGTSEAVQPG
jgi:integrase